MERTLSDQRLLTWAFPAPSGEHSLGCLAFASLHADESTLDSGNGLSFFYRIQQPLVRTGVLDNDRRLAVHSQNFRAPDSFESPTWLSAF